MRQLTGIFILFSLFFQGFGQQKSVHGSVLDFSGQPVINHRVHLYADSTNFPGFYTDYTVFTDSFGMYSQLVNVPDVTGDIYVSTTDCQLNGIVNVVNYNSGASNYQSDFNYCGFSSNLGGQVTVDSTTIPFEVTATPINGIPPYSYYWSTNDTSQSIFVSDGGNICVTITDITNTKSVVCKAVFPTCEAVFSHSRQGTVAEFTAEPIGYQPFSYSWDFNDGNQSTTANPVHDYGSVEGIDKYKVCLTITDGANCSNVACQSVFISSNPNSGRVYGSITYNDTFALNGTLFIYAQDVENGSPVITLIDSLVAPDGTFQINHLPYGEYLFKAKTSNIDPEADRFIPSYYPSTFHWADGSSIIHNQDNREVDLELVEQNTTAFSTGNRITGTVSYPSGMPAKGYSIIAFNYDLNQVVDITSSNSDGSYELKNLVSGNTQVYVDEPGKSNSPYLCNLIEPNDHRDNIDWEVRTSDIFGLWNPSSTSNTSESKEIYVAPNPFRNFFVITSEAFDWGARISIYNQQGTRIEQGVFNKKMIVNATSWPKGIYYITISERDRVMHYTAVKN